MNHQNRNNQVMIQAIQMTTQVQPIKNHQKQTSQMQVKPIIQHQMTQKRIRQQQKMIHQIKQIKVHKPTHLRQNKTHPMQTKMDGCQAMTMYNHLQVTQAVVIQVA